jgi:predicted RNA-binding Zn-ribbon protein involved in translation (DUF1610 family)
MTEDIPRRLQRFYRKKPSETEIKERSTQIAINKVDEFVKQNNRYPNKDEINKMAENVYELLKKEFENDKEEKNEFEDDIDLGGFEKPEAKENLLEKRKEERKKKKDEKDWQEKQKEKVLEQTEDEEKIENIQNEDNFEDDLEVEQSQEIEHIDTDNENLQKLAEIDELSSLEDNLSEDEFDMVDKEIETGLNVCPRCGNKSEELIYCPKCGEAFCDHCAKSVEVQAESLKYTCPKCGAEFRKRKNR